MTTLIGHPSGCYWPGQKNCHYYGKHPGLHPGIKKSKKECNTMQTGTFKKTGPVKICEPVTTLLDEGKYLRIITELPGIAEERIKIDLENSPAAVIIVASDAEKHYKKVIAIPCGVRFSRKRFSDGVLELTLEKTGYDTL
jgi:HSP20 family molecular chaperone IbpA